jgi:integral membrane sensor domain MASE1
MKTLVAVNLLVASVYMLAGKLGLAFASVHPSATPVWPPTGIALAALLVCGSRVWPSVLVGAFFVNQTTAGTAVTSGTIAVGNTLEGLLGAYLVTRFANGRHALGRSRDVFAFVALGALLSTTVSATVGVASLALGGYADWPAAGPMWLTWWLGDVAGALIVAPVILAWSSASRTPWPRRRIAEAAAMLALLVFTGQVVFGRWHAFPADDYPLEFLSMPVLIWAAFRFGQPITATAVLLLSLQALVGTLLGSGPFARHSLNESLVLLQGFLGTIAVTSMVLAAAVTERKQAAEELRRSAGRVIAATERTRREIAELLHGHVQNRLVGAWHALSTCERLYQTDPAEALALLRRVRQEIDELREREIRQASYLLHPTFIREGLGPAVDALAERFEGHVAVTLALSPAFGALDTPVDNRLPEPLRLAAFRVIEEALGNAVRHGRASAVHIALGVAADRHLTLAVEDDGCGFDIGRVKPGLGLSSIEGWVSQVGGSWQIASRPGGGTILAAQLPLSSAGPYPDAA